MVIVLDWSTSLFNQCFIFDTLIHSICVDCCWCSFWFGIALMFASSHFKKNFSTLVHFKRAFSKIWLFRRLRVKRILLSYSRMLFSATSPLNVRAVNIFIRLFALILRRLRNFLYKVWFNHWKMSYPLKIVCFNA